jgi:hypothetical protein
MDFEIDVSGEDIWNHDYTIVIAEKSNTSFIRGFKFTKELIQILRTRHGEGQYRYSMSKQDKSLFRVRTYCIVVYYLFKKLKLERGTEINLHICRDFQGHERDITSNLKPLIEKLGLKINKPIYQQLPKGSIADKYAYLLRNDTKNQFKNYFNISLEEIEEFLKKK